jgi:serine/threonine protein kinase
MATVYAVTQVRVNYAFALKKLHPELRLRRDIHQRFLREGWLANAVAIEHPGAVRVFEDGVDDDDLPFLVMELLEGAAVDALVSNFGSKLPLRETLCIAHQLLEVLDAAHEKGIVHRDIKPANLFVCRDGRLKVLDFGISKLRSAAVPSADTTNSLVGTPAFMSPEQARAEASDPRSDLFSVGATLFAILSGEQLHPGNGAEEVIRRASRDPARSLRSVAPETPSCVVELIEKAVAFEPLDRWASAAAMREAVMEAHGALFGPLCLGSLAALLTERPASMGSLATQPWCELEGAPTIVTVNGKAGVAEDELRGTRAHLPAVLSSIDLPLSAGTIDLCSIAASTPATRGVRPAWMALAAAAALVAITFGVLHEQKSWAQTDPGMVPATATPAEQASLADGTARQISLPVGRGTRASLAVTSASLPTACALPSYEPAHPVADGLPPASASRAKRQQRQPGLLPSDSSRATEQPTRGVAAHGSRKALLLPTPFLPPTLPLPDR